MTDFINCWSAQKQQGFTSLAATVLLAKENLPLKKKKINNASSKALGSVKSWN